MGTTKPIVVPNAVKEILGMIGVMVTVNWTNPMGQSASEKIPK